MTAIGRLFERTRILRGRVVRRTEWQDVAIGLVTFAAITLLPLLLGGHVHERGFSQYGLLWRELIGEAGRMPLETPKPFTTLRAALGEGPYLWAAAAIFSLTPVFLGRLSLRLYGTRIVGVGSVLLLLLGSSHFLSGPVLDAFWPLCYLGLTALGLYAFAVGRYGPALAAVAVAGLIRPDAWGYLMLVILLIALADRRELRALHFSALLCVPAWLLYDFVLTGDPLYSFSTLGAYRAVMGVPPVTFDTFWSRLVPDVSQSYVAPLLAVGALGLLIALVRSRPFAPRAKVRWRAHGFAAGIVALGALGYWALSGLGDGILLHVRFFVLPLLLLHFYALALPLECLGWRDERKRSRTSGGALRRGLAAVVVAAAIGIGWSRTNAWAETKDAHRILLLQKEARADALEYLRARWVGTDRSLLTGRSLEVFAHRLGPDAARRMHFFRVVAEDPPQLPGLAPGVAVYIGHDIAGADNWFVFLRRGEAAEVGELGVRFYPRVTLEHDGQALGLIYEFRRAPPPAASGAAGRRR